MTATTIAHLKITLDDVKPEVLRRIEVPFNIRLDHLHLAIQAAMGWTNTHLYEIRAGDVGWGVPDPDWGDGPLDARKAHLHKVLEDVGTKTVKYIYDFGDGWDHTIKIERLNDAVPGLTYPFLIEAKGAALPRTSVARPATPSSWKPSVIPNTNVTTNAKPGSARPSIRPLSTPTGLPNNSLPY